MHIGPEYNVFPRFGALLAASGLFFVTGLSAAHSVGFVPYYIDGSAPRTISVQTLPELGEEIRAFSETPSATPVAPERVVIPAIDLDLSVQNIESRDLAVLDEALKDGPVRHMDSAKLGEKGNVFIFGHSSRLPVVRNEMYKAFNRVPELSEGDLIKVFGGGREFHYRVKDIRSIEVTDPEAVLIDNSREGKRLTIVTCDNLTGKSARFVLEAELVSEY